MWSSGGLRKRTDSLRSPRKKAPAPLVTEELPIRRTKLSPTSPLRRAFRTRRYLFIFGSGSILILLGLLVNPFVYLRRAIRKKATVLIEGHILLPQDDRYVMLGDNHPLHPHPYAFTKPNDNPYYKDLLPLRRVLAPDYNELEIASLLLQPTFFRARRQNDWAIYHRERKRFLKSIDLKSLSHKYYSWEDRVDIEDPRGCERPKWTYEQRPVCNSMHEIDHLALSPQHIEQNYDIKYLAHGYFRETYLFTPLSTEKEHVATGARKRNPAKPLIRLTPDAVDVDQSQEQQPFVLKHLRFHEDFEYAIWDYLSIHNEALVFDILSSSARVTDLYGFCATSTLVQVAKELTYAIVPDNKYVEERGRISQTELDKLQKDDAYPMNQLSPEEKLWVAIAMAESLAEMHGFDGGVIAHNDVQPDQWLVTEEGRVVLNDVNNAKVLEWNEENNEYCDFQIIYDGNFRSAEEYQKGIGVDERADVFTFGNMVFTLLTGLWPFYEEYEDEIIMNATIAGETPYIDPRYKTRSLIEGRLVEIMDQCLKLEKEERPTMFHVVKFLRETLRMYEASERKE